MNSLNMITSRVSPPPSSPPTRSNSFGTLGLSITEQDEKAHALTAQGHDTDGDSINQAVYDDHDYDEKSHADETTPLFGGHPSLENRSYTWASLPRRIVSNFVNSIRWVLATLASPGVYLMSCFYDEDGKFAPMTQLKKLFGVYPDRSRKNSAHHHHHVYGNQAKHRRASASLGSNLPGSNSKIPNSSTSSLVSVSESDSDETQSIRSQHARSQSTDDGNSSRRSIRIKLTNDDAVRQRKQHRKTASTASRTKGNEFDEELSAHIKSPTSPIAALTRYPKAPAPPRPLIPRRQPSYLNLEPSRKHLKTLILDLDETLIHSMSKGGRSSSGHMVEVRLNAASLGLGSGSGGAAQHPILYWVNKRPFCDEFLRRICKWYNLVVFTASVQEYADPVIDWLESEKKFFSARYYRQHCTFRQGAYIKDLSSVEPDLSKVMILDNSPLSYLFHEGMHPSITRMW